MKNLGSFLNSEFVTTEDLNKLIAIHQNHQRIISYSLNGENGISIYSHAPIGFEMIGYLAKTLGVPYKDATTKELAVTIEQINEKYLDAVKSGTLHKRIDMTVMGLVGGLENNNRALELTQTIIILLKLRLGLDKDALLPPEQLQMIREAKTGPALLRKLGINPALIPQ